MPSIPVPPHLQCRIAGCGRRRHQEGLCQAHYKRLRNGQALDTPIRGRHENSTVRCSVSGCDRFIYSRGFCPPHYQRFMAGKNLDAPLNAPPKTSKEFCLVEDCTRKVAGRNLCRTHYNRFMAGLPCDTPIASRNAPMEQYLNEHSKEDDNGCLVWTGAKRGGYGLLPRSRQEFGLQAHRTAYIAAHGPVPKTLDIHHTCHNRACINPDHLVPLDRQSHQLLHRRRTIISDDDCTRLEELYATGAYTQKEVAALFGISRTYTSNIINGTARCRRSP